MWEPQWIGLLCGAAGAMGVAGIIFLASRFVKLRTRRQLHSRGDFPSAQTRTQTHDEEPPNTAERELLLLVEENDRTRKYLTEILSPDYRVAGFKDGALALMKARELNPDIVITDIPLRGVSGYDICRELRSRVETSHIPVIMLSALSEKENIIMGLEAGADDYITKPFDPAVLRARIRSVLARREKLREMILSAERPPEIDFSNSLDKEFLDRAIALVEGELSNPDFTVGDLCRALGMSRTSTYNKLKTLTNQGPADFIRIIRLNKAHSLLRSKRYFIGEVADMVGFSDSKYFSTCFKKQFGVSPSKVNQDPLLGVALRFRQSAASLRGD